MAKKPSKPQKKAVAQAPAKKEAVVEAASATKKAPVKIAFKKTNLTKILIVAIALLVLIPLLDLLIQFSIIGRYAAFVGQTQVTRNSYEKELERRYGQAIIQDLIVEKIIANEVKTQNIAVNEERVTQELDGIKSQFSGEEEFQEILKAENLTEEEVKARIRLQLGLQEIVRASMTPITDESIQSYYDQNKQLYEGQTFEESKESIRKSLEDAELSTKGDEWLNGKLTALSADNNLTLTANKQYKFFQSINLIGKLFGRN
ncbi:MAG: SurA N-terminal domain-containing protein [Candidatus Dojkabacteria bacterium]|nr:MAG: SurA N-terminal domain-containing protein [Candidatus Dojkabacteria bacterium]